MRKKNGDKRPPDPAAEPAIIEEIKADEPTGASPPPQRANAETKQLLKLLKEQQKRRVEQELAEAKDMQRKARDMAKNAKQHAKVRQAYEAHADEVRRLAPQLGLDPERAITPIPEIGSPELSQVELSTIHEGRSYVRVLFDARENRYHYEVIEPPLSPSEGEILEFLRDTLVRTLDGRGAGEEEDGWESYLSDAIERAILDHHVLVDEVSKQRLQYHLVRDFLGYGPIDVLMRDPMIEDISCDGPGIPIYIFHRQYESIRTNVKIASDHKLDGFVIRLAQRCGKHISIADPLLDATLPDTSRLQATLAREVTTRGSSFTVRKFRADPLTPPDLVRLGTMDARMAAWLWLAMGEGAPMLLAGGTASGKTTTLNAVAQFIPPAKKIVSIEDTREINLKFENWIAGLTRSGFSGEATGAAIDMYKLLEAALRQRPEYLLVGEVRGPEALTLFQAMATGHATYSTLHGDSVASAVHRLENPPINVPRMMLSTLDAIMVQVQARRNNKLVRRIKEVTEIVGIDAESGDLLTNQVFRWDPSTDRQQYLGRSNILDEIALKNGLTREQIENEWADRAMVLEWMVDKGVRHIDDVANVIAAYYARPKELMQRVREAQALNVGARPSQPGGAS